jgi:hypothetical protein
MTNIEIVESEKMVNGITEEVHTFIEWKMRNYKIKKGSKALIKTKLWKVVNAKQKDENGNVEETRKYILVNASLFGKSQVEKMEVIS